MDIYFSVGKELGKSIGSNELKKLSSNIEAYSDDELRDKIIIMCLSHNIECQAVIDLPRSECRKELIAVLQILHEYC